VPGRGAVQVSDTAVTPAATSVENGLHARPCVGGVPTPSARRGRIAGDRPRHRLRIGVIGTRRVVAVVRVHRPSWPTIVSEVGTVLPFKNDSCLVRLICSVWPVEP